MHPAFTGWRGAVMALVVLVWLAMACVGLITQAEHVGVFPDRAGRMGYNDSGGGHAPGWILISSVNPGGAAEALGIVPGDEVRLPNPFYNSTSLPPGTKMAIVIRHQGQEAPGYPGSAPV